MPSSPSDSPSMTPSTPAEPRRTLVRKLGRTAVAISWPVSLKKLAAPTLATPPDTQGGRRPLPAMGWSVCSVVGAWSDIVAPVRRANRSHQPWTSALRGAPSPASMLAADPPGLWSEQVEQPAACPRGSAALGLLDGLLEAEQPDLVIADGGHWALLPNVRLATIAGQGPR